MTNRGRGYSTIQVVGVSLLILVVAALFRTWHLGSVPPGLFGDEAVNGLDALDVLAGRGQVFFPANYGREGLHMYLIAAFFRLLGVTSMALRLPSVLAGIFTALATAWLGWELFAGSDKRVRAITAASSALWLATAYWHVHFSRFGIRGVFTPLCGALAFAAFWRGVNRREGRDAVRDQEAPYPGAAVAPGRQRSSNWLSRGFGAGLGWFVLSGFFLGLSVHFYTASRLYPVFLGLFLLAQAIVVRRLDGKRSVLLRDHFWPLVGLFAVAALVFAPLGYYFLTHPGSFAQRASTVVAFGQETSPWRQMGRALVGNVAQFFLPGQGDRAWFYNLPGRSILEPITAALTLVGLFICIIRLRRRAYLFVLLWWPVMLIPAVLAVDRVPTAPRVLGTMPGIYLFPAIAVGAAVQWIGERVRRPRWRRVGNSLVIGIPLLAAGVWTAVDYFAVWAPSAETYEAFDGEMRDAAEWLQANPQPWPLYVSAEFYRHPSFMLLYGQVPTTEIFDHQDPAIRWCDARTSLPLPPPGREATYVFTGVAHLSEERLSRYVPDGYVVDRMFDPAGGPSVTVYRATYRDRMQNVVDHELAAGVRLVGYDVYGEARPGVDLDVALYHRIEAAPYEGRRGYRVQLGVEDGSGARWNSTDDPVTFRPAEWDAGGRFVSWHRVQVPAEAARGPYEVLARWWDEESDAPAGQWVSLSSARLEGPRGSGLQAVFGPGLRLLESSVQLQQGDGGDTLAVELLLQAEMPFDQSYTLFLHALDADGQRVGQRDSATGGGLFPIDLWSPGQVVRDVYRVPVDVAEVRRPYRLALGFYDWRTGERLPAVGPDGDRLPEDQFVFGL